jgi:hypothetical protein
MLFFVMLLLLLLLKESMDIVGRPRHTKLPVLLWGSEVVLGFGSGWEL